MHQLLKDMRFHLITGFWILAASFCNDENFPAIGQGLL